MLLDFFIVKKRILKLLEGRFKSPDIVLDVGCGNNPYYHKSIKAKIVCADIIGTKKAHIVCNAMSLPVKKSCFDGIICVNSLYYHDNPFASAKEFAHALRKSGKLAVIMPFIYPIHDAPYDKYRFTEYGIRELLKNNFEIKEITTIGGIFNIPAVFFHSLIKGIPLLVHKRLRKIASILAIIALYPFYIPAQLLSLLDFLDRTRRWPTYYFVFAVRK